MNALRLLAIIALAAFVWPADVRATDTAHDTCGVSGATSVSIGNYNPFTGSSFNQVPVTLNLTRFVASNNRKTQVVNFYFVLPAGSPSGYAIRYQGSNVLYTLPSWHLLSVLIPLSGTVYYDFRGNGQPDTVSIPLVVTIPPGLDLTAGSPIVFDIVYVCTGTGGMNYVLLPQTLENAITLRIDVASALQASYAGTALDFGEIGAVTDAQAQSHTASGMIRVASTGPYSVSLSSTNSYRMTYPGGNLNVANQSIRYATRFLGQTPDSTNPTFTPVTCKPAGLGGQNLPISVSLHEGGVAKTPAPNYLDILTVTVTPLAVPFGGTAWNCPNLQ